MKYTKTYPILFLLFIINTVSVHSQDTQHVDTEEHNCIVINNLFPMSIDKESNNSILFFMKNESDCERILENNLIKQEGTDQFVLIFQNGINDKLWVDQNGKSNRISIIQDQTTKNDTTLTGNSATIKQTGDNNSVQIRQH
ncbi:MAG: hypothetical protein WEA58_15335 [Balneolaceae bacterium]